MPSYARMRDRLPSLWRPEDDDASGDQLPLAPADVLEVECEPAREANFTQRSGTVIATLAGKAKVKALRIVPDRALSTGCAVEIYRVSGTQPQTVPALAAVVQDGRAELPIALELDRFAIRLRRPGLVSLLLRTASEAVDRMDREAAEVMQAHWQPHADRALLSPFWHRTRELQGLVVPRPADLVDVVKPAALIAKLRAPDTPFLTWLAGELSPRARALMARYTGGRVPDVLQRALVDDLDELAEGTLIYDEARFAGIELDADTLDQLGLSSPAGSPPAGSPPEGSPPGGSPPDDSPTDILGPPTGGLDLVLLNRRLMVLALGGMIDESLLDSPWVDDLARIGSVLALPHWREPADEPESVEEYRERQRRVVALYADGLGTVGAMRRMVEAQLPIDGEMPPERRDRAWLFEESPALGREVLAATTDGAPDGILGPLMRFTANNQGAGAVPATVYIQGQAPQGDEIAATERPVVELYAAGGEKPRIAIAYDGVVPAGMTLRLRPSFGCWVGRSRGLYRAWSRPTADEGATPIPIVPWKKMTGTPPKVVMDLLQTRDRVVWGAFGEPNASLWRCDHVGWHPAVTGLAEIHCLFEDGDTLLIGCDDGIRRIPLFPEDGQFTPVKLGACDGIIVNTLVRLADGRLLAGTEKGLAHVSSDTTAAPFLLDGSLGSETPVYALEQETDGTLYVGCSKGLFLHRPASNETWWLANQDVSDQVPDWQAFHPEKHLAADKNFPGEGDVFIPPVLCLHRGRDESLWLGTEKGIARYLAQPIRGLTYTTLVQAYPDLVTGPVHSIYEDERGEVWFCTERGCFRYDGRDLWQLVGKRWSQLGRADTRYGAKVSPRPAYRYDRASDTWQTRSEHAWVPAHDTLRSAPEKPVRSVLWTDGVAADLGTWDGSAFTPSGDVVDATRLRVRYKPSERRIVTGGIPAVPRLPMGESVWRYLSLEPAGTTAPPLLPAWSIEGRLFPPPPELPAPYPGRFDLAMHGENGIDDSYDHVVFAYTPAARVWLEWSPRRTLTVLARLQRRRDGETIDPAVLERTWQGMRQVKPAGVLALLAVDETIVRGN